MCLGVNLRESGFVSRELWATSDILPVVPRMEAVGPVVSALPPQEVRLKYLVDLGGTGGQRSET